MAVLVRRHMEAAKEELEIIRPRVGVLVGSGHDQDMAFAEDDPTHLQV